RLIDAARKTFVGLLIVERNAQTLAASSRRRLDHDRVADALRDPDGLIRARNRLVVAGNGIDLGFERELLRLDLVAHLADRVVFRPDELDPLFLKAPRK